ncbi:NAD-glutamate dehydrogenase [Williamsia muralis]|uniref:NAD-glutamate dehydrogenase n=1 Tax=Williamsia marianensis TaxID=85044 RepID=UPI003825B8EB
MTGSTKTDLADSRGDDSSGAIKALLPQAVAPYFHGPGSVDETTWDELGPEQRSQLSAHVTIAYTRADGIAVTDVAFDGSAVSVSMVTDDMPLLVESVVAALEASGLMVVRIDHPIMLVVRDDRGELREIVDSDKPTDTVRTGQQVESWIHVDAVPRVSPIDIDVVRTELDTVIARIADVHDDRAPMLDLLTGLADTYSSYLTTTLPDGVDRAAGEDFARLLRWLAENNFTPFGYLHCDGAGTDRTPLRSSGLGVWRTAEVEHKATQGAGAVTVQQLYLPTRIQRSNFPSLIQIDDYDDNGHRVGEHVFVGRFTPTALHENIFDIPVLDTKVGEVLAAAEVEAESYTGMAMLELLQTFPRSELFSLQAGELARTLTEVLEAVPNRQLRVFLRPEPAGEIVSALVYLPRDRYTTRLRETLQNELLSELGGDALEYTARVSESPLALLHVAMRISSPACAELGDLAVGSPGQVAIQDRLIAAARGWDERLRQVAANSPGVAGPEVVAFYAATLPDSYKDIRAPSEAYTDIDVVQGLDDGAFEVRLHRPVREGAESAEKIPAQQHWRFAFYLCGRSATLTEVLPVLHSLGVNVLDERPYELRRPDGQTCHIYELSLSLAEGMAVDEQTTDDVEHRFTDAFAQIWRADAEVDDFNELVFRCGLTWREAAVLRAYSKYLRQCGSSYSNNHVASVLGAHPAITKALVELFAASFDPDTADDDRRSEVLDGLSADVGSIISLDVDRIISAYISVISATVRTNYYVAAEHGSTRNVLAFKLRPRDIPQTPEPRPLYEIYVYSPRVEGVHLRFGSVARGGLRWSDRREDFRTEILGLVKAQAVKNAVIVPVGSKGGFVVKRPPLPTGDPTADRDAYRAEGVECYRHFISGLLDLTDNIDQKSGDVTAPTRVVRRDDDDPYLVVAADKGTATFSDIANDVAGQYGFWLGDAFASGGSAGYDHKAMGITARGAWEAVKRHFREMGVDTQTEDFTVVGIGDMSGDVFGNGMLLSGHIRLTAAFDHRHIFIDPDPDAAKSFAERQRLFELPRSSWADYNTELISEGGGVWSRDRKSIDISPQIARALGVPEDVSTLSPPELIRAILLAPADLLWNGGIGTYVKASTQSHEAVGDKANDAIRVDGNELRVKVVGEGGNLGVTELGRIEFDLSGGRINTDAMDNSAGVDCSDHEVNIKILLDSQVSAGELAAEDRNPLLESMTEEVGDLVLADNVSQNAELGTSRSQAAESAEVYVRLLKELAGRGVNLKLEALPRPAELIKRGESTGRHGLTSPELATLMAHVKLALKSDMLDGDLPDNDVFSPRLMTYFPVPLRERFAEGIATHPLRREIVTTAVVNDLVDNAGITHVFRLCEGSGSTSLDVVRSFQAVTQIFGLHGLWQDIASAPCSVPTTDAMITYARRLLFRASRWMIAGRPQPLAMAAEVTRYAALVAELSPQLPGWLRGSSAEGVERRAQRLRDDGVPAEIAEAVAVSLHRFCLLDIIDAAEISDREPAEVGELYFEVMDHLGVEDLLTAVSDLDRKDRWHSLARLALRDDLHSTLRSLCLVILDSAEPDESPAEKIADWELSNSSRLARVRTTLSDIAELGELDLATLSVAARQLRSSIR